MKSCSATTLAAHQPLLSRVVHLGWTWPVVVFWIRDSTAFSKSNEFLRVFLFLISFLITSKNQLKCCIRLTDKSLYRIPYFIIFVVVVCKTSVCSALRSLHTVLHSCYSDMRKSINFLWPDLMLSDTQHAQCFSVTPVCVCVLHL